MPKLKDFIKGYNNPDTVNIAGYIDGSDFKYYISQNYSLPAAAYLVEKLGDRCKDKIFTNLPKTHWIMTYLKSKVKYSTYLEIDDKYIIPIANTDIVPKIITTLPLSSSPQGPTITAPLGGGLYLAAKGMRAGVTLTGRNKGLERALRYYMLAAYTLLRFCKLESYEGIGNYVAALMVNDSGKILSAGINTASYRHAEVNMLLNYFKNNPTVKKFPENTIIFSTLTPCEQCTKYLKTAMPGNSVIYFGQMDTGPKGRAGAEISSSISSRTKPLRGITPWQSKSDIDSALDKLRPVTTETGGVVKAQIDDGLKTCVSGPNIARQIEASAEADVLLQSALDALDHKMTKDRGDYTAGSEQDIKEKVLMYLAEWLIFIDI